MDAKDLALHGAGVARPADAVESADGFGVCGDDQDFCARFAEGLCCGGKFGIVADEDAEVAERSESGPGMDLPFFGLPLGEDIFGLDGDLIGADDEGGVDDSVADRREVSAGHDGLLAFFGLLSEESFDGFKFGGKSERDLGLGQGAVVGHAFEVDGFGKDDEVSIRGLV